MDWINRLNRAIGYIEEQITGDIDMEKVASIAGCSSYHFQRMFAYMSDVSLSEYIRRRKMSLAAAELLSGEKKIIDIALQYGYESPTAFTRAFKNVHGVAPSQIGEKDVEIKAYPPIRFHITIKGECEMNYRIVKKEAFKIVGISMPLEKEVEKNFENVPQMWGRASMDGTIPKLLEMANTEVKGILGVSTCNDKEDWKYFIAAATTLEVPEGMEAFEVPAATWAIFRGEGKMLGIQELECKIVTDWLPTSGYEYANAPDIEVYFNADPEHAIYEVWIPIVKK